MRLERLVTERFRNLASMDLEVGAPFVVLSGPNAQGKTNTLEAIHLLATLKPLRGRRTPPSSKGWDLPAVGPRCGLVLEAGAAGRSPPGGG